MDEKGAFLPERAAALIKNGLGEMSRVVYTSYANPTLAAGGVPCPGGRAGFEIHPSFNAEPKRLADVSAFVDNEFLPQLKAIPGILDAARYVAVKGGPRYLAAYELESADVIHSDAFVNRPKTPEDERLAPSVIGKNLTRIVGEQIFPHDVENPDRPMAPALQIGRM